MNLSQTGLLYNPQLQSAEVVEKLFLVRRRQFELLLNKISQEKEDGIPQHHLIIGQWGMGKTMLLKRMEVELHKDKYRQRFIPLLYREKQYNVKNLADFWLNSLDALADSLQSEKYQGEMLADIDKTIQELKKTSDIISEKAYKYLMDRCSELQRRPVWIMSKKTKQNNGLYENF
jgi:type II secretory pathway predicted ATPase ExeA